MQSFRRYCYRLFAAKASLLGLIAGIFWGLLPWQATQAQLGPPPIGQEGPVVHSIVLSLQVQPTQGERIRRAFSSGFGGELAMGLNLFQNQLIAEPLFGVAFFGNEPQQGFFDYLTLYEPGLRLRYAWEGELFGEAVRFWPAVAAGYSYGVNNWEFESGFGVETLDVMRTRGIWYQIGAAALWRNVRLAFGWRGTQASFQMTDEYLRSAELSYPGLRLEPVNQDLDLSRFVLQLGYQFNF